MLQKRNELLCLGKPQVFREFFHTVGLPVSQEVQEAYLKARRVQGQQHFKHFRGSGVAVEQRQRLSASGYSVKDSLIFVRKIGHNLPPNQFFSMISKAQITVAYALLLCKNPDSHALDLLF